MVDAAVVENAITDRTILISIMAAIMKLEQLRQLQKSENSSQP